MSRRANVIDLTAGGIQFASWPTSVENDNLQLVDVSFGGCDEVSFPQEGFTLRLPPELAVAEAGVLTATFFSKQQRSIVTFTFRGVSAFRVLDEDALLDVWEASSKTPLPAKTTFRVRGHRWQDESVLAWVHGADEDHFSLMIATGAECLEVVAFEEPDIELRPAVVTSYASPKDEER